MENIDNKFKELVMEIFKSYSISVKEEQLIEDKYIDLIIKDQNDRDALVELKVYRSKKVHISQIKSGLNQLLFYLTDPDISNGVLIVSSFIAPAVKRSLRDEFGITIWDRSSLFYLTQKAPELRAKLENLLVRVSEDSGEDIFDGVSKYERDIDISGIWRLNKKTLDLDRESKGSTLCKELQDISAGRGQSSDFEKKCQEALEYIFEYDLVSWHKQARTDDGLNQFDLICRIASTHDFWLSLSRNFNCRYVLFEFKNYSDKIKQGQVYTTEKYLFNRALRSVGFIIAKNGADKNAVKAMKGALREHGKLLIPLTQDDLCKMLILKDNGDDPNSYLAQKVDKFLISMSR